MKGRWIISPFGGITGGPGIVNDGFSAPVPVVPCDDVAIERATGAAMDAIVESYDVIVEGREPDVEAWALKLAVRAIEAGFKAAGKTP